MGYFYQNTSRCEASSLEGIGRPAAVSARRMKTRYTRIGSILVILIILISIISLSGKAFINDVDEKIDSICKTQTDLDCTHLKFKENGKIDEFTVGITTYQIWTKLWWFDVFLAGFAQNEIKKIYNNAKGYDGQFFEAMWSARSVEDKFTTVYVTIIGGFLPIMYTVLGAVAFGIRDLRQSTAERTWTQASEMGATLRLFLAIVVGAVFGLFSDFAKGVSLSPIALGFVVGYGVEAFFNFLDSLLGSLGFRSKAEPQAQK